MKKAKLDNRYINMSLLFLRSTGQSLHKMQQQQCPKRGNAASSTHRQLLQERQHDQNENDLSDLSSGQLVLVQYHDMRKSTPAVVRQARTEPGSYIVETPTGKVLRRNRRHLMKYINKSNKTLTSLHKTFSHHTKPPPPPILQTYILLKHPTHTPA